MAISLKNHEERIARLETSNGITHGTGWINIGSAIEIRYGQGPHNSPSSSFETSRTITFSKAFTKTVRTVVVSTTNNNAGCDFTCMVTAISASNFKYVPNQTGTGGQTPSLFRCEYIAIGYLISYRILNYAYAYIKSLRDFKAIIKSHSFCKLLSKISREVI